MEKKDVKRAFASANASPMPPAPDSLPSSPSLRDDEDDEDEFVDAPDPELAVIPHPVTETKTVAKMGLPSAELTYAALDLALQLPGTEWIFQFLVIFVGWFGMFLGPAPRRSRY